MHQSTCAIEGRPSRGRGSGFDFCPPLGGCVCQSHLRIAVWTVTQHEAENILVSRRLRAASARQRVRRKTRMATRLRIGLPRDEGWAGLLEGADRDHYFRSDRQRSLCGQVVVLSSVGALTKDGGNKSCCRACKDLHLAQLSRLTAQASAANREQPCWEPRGGKNKRHCFSLPGTPTGIMRSLCGNAILLPSLQSLLPGLAMRVDQLVCPSCTHLARRDVIFDHALPHRRDR